VRAVVAYIIGAVLTEFGAPPGLEGDEEVRRPRLRRGDFPHLTALIIEPTVSNPDADFEFGLDLVMRSVVTMRPARAVAG
jgi:hypothetical protein